MRPVPRSCFLTAAAILLVLITPRPASAPNEPLCDVTCEPDPGSPTYQDTLMARPLPHNGRGGASPTAPPASTGAGATALPGSESYNYAVPILSLPGRNGLDLNLTLYYNSRIWTIDKVNGTATFNADRDFPSYGFRLGYGYLEGPFDNALGTTSYLLTEPDGSKRELRQRAGTTNLFDSFDSSYITWVTSTQRLFRKDGSFWTYELAPNSTTLYRPFSIRDTNGNFLWISYVTGKDQEILAIRDTVGRDVWFNYDANGKLCSLTRAQSNCAPATDITYATFLWELRSLTYNFALAVVDSPPSGSTHNVLTRITFPNGTSYNFVYANFWGMIQTIERRSSSFALTSSVSYNWPDASTALSDHPTFGAQTVFDGVNTVQWIYAVAKTNGLVSTLCIMDPSGKTIYHNLWTSGWQAGLPDNITTVDQSGGGSNHVQTVRMEWSQDSAVPFNSSPRVFRVTTTLHQPQPDLVSKVELTYGTFGNVTNFYEYDFGSGAPGPLVRQTQTDYLHDVNFTYLNNNILDRPREVRAYNAGGALKSKTVLQYDTTTAMDLSPDPSSLNWTPAGVRANLTAITRYADAAAGSGAVTRNFTYDEAGNLRQADLDCCQQRQWTFTPTTAYSLPETIVTGPSGGPQLTTSRIYDVSRGLLRFVTDENNRTTELSYFDSGGQLDPMLRVRAVIRPDGAVFRTDYDDASPQPQVTSINPIDATKTLVQATTTDGLGRPIRQYTLNAVGGSTFSIVDTQYDGLGRPTQVSNPYTGSPSAWTTYAYNDPFGRLTSVTPPGGQGSYSYAYDGQTVTVTDPAGKKRKTVTDALGRLTQVVEPDDAGALTLSSTYAYDVLDNLTQVSQGVQTRAFVYDSMSRLTSATTPEAGAVGYTYTSFSQVQTRTDARGIVTTYSYDGLNRPIQITYSNGDPTIGLEYDSSVVWTVPVNNPKGRLVRIAYLNPPSFWIGTIFSYDALGRVEFDLNVSQPTASYPNTQVNYAYNFAGELTSITYPSGRVVSYTHDSIGRLTQASSGGTNYLSGVAYNPAHQPESFNYGNGVAADPGYNSRMQLSYLKYSKGSTKLLEQTYNYAHPNGGNNGQITGIIDSTGTAEAGRTVNYTYDPMSRLKTAATQGSTSYPQWSLNWVYDRYGNRSQQNATGGAPSMQLTISQATNRVTQIGGVATQFDASGNMTKDDINCYTYNAENRMKELKNSACTSVVASYLYSPGGLRWRRTLGATTTHSVYAGSKVIAEYTNSYSLGSPTKEYIYAGSQLIATVAGNTKKYFHQDHLSTRVVTKSNGQVDRTFGHYPFGEAWYETGVADKWKFTSYERDVESGLDYAMFRYHAPRLGRFQSPDPIAGSVSNPQSLNRYAYVRNDPVNLTDPLGLFPCPLDDNGNPIQMRGCDPWGNFVVSMSLGIQLGELDYDARVDDVKSAYRLAYYANLDDDDEEAFRQLWGIKEVKDTDPNNPFGYRLEKFDAFRDFFNYRMTYPMRGIFDVFGFATIRSALPTLTTPFTSRTAAPGQGPLLYESERYALGRPEFRSLTRGSKGPRQLPPQLRSSAVAALILRAVYLSRPKDCLIFPSSCYPVPY